MLDYECEKHLKQACINERLVYFLYTDCRDKIFYKWLFVVAYYSALHYFSAFLKYTEHSVPMRHKSFLEGEGLVDLAKRIFDTKFDDRKFDFAGDDYEQLFKWSNIVRYYPERESELDKQAKAVLSFLDRIKLVTFNETKHIPKIKKGKILIKKLI